MDYKGYDIVVVASVGSSGRYSYNVAIRKRPELLKVLKEHVGEDFHDSQSAFNAGLQFGRAWVDAQ